MLAVNMTSGSVVTSGTPTKNVPVNSSSDSRNTKIALAISPGAASGRVTVRKQVHGEAPRVRAASSSEASTAANAAEAIHTASTRPGKAHSTRLSSGPKITNARSASRAARANACGSVQPLPGARRSGSDGGSERVLIARPASRVRLAHGVAQVERRAHRSKQQGHQAQR